MAKSAAKKTSVKTTAKTAVKTTAKAAVNVAAKVAKVMTTTTTAATTRHSAADQNLFGLPMTTWIGSARKPKGGEARSGKRAFLLAFGVRDQKALKKTMSEHLNRWQLAMALESDSDVQFFQGSQGPLWILRAPVTVANASEAALEKSGYARFRDLAGPVVSAVAHYQMDRLLIETFGLTRDEERGILVGLEMAAYSYQEARG